MGRAERRRAEKRNKKRTSVYSVPKGALSAAVKEKFNENLEALREEVKDEAVNDALILTLALPCKVLMDKYWPKSYHERLPGFVNDMLELYKLWQDDKITTEELEKILWDEGGVKFVKSDKEV